VEGDLQNSVEVVRSCFQDVTLGGDVVYFEFCLHEMDDVQKALSHARTLAPDIVVYDHLPGSDWVFHAAEEDKVRRSAEAMKRFGVRRRERFCTEQCFRDHAELLAKATVQGAIAIQRAQRFAGATSIAIPMRYELALFIAIEKYECRSDLDWTAFAGKSDSCRAGLANGIMIDEGVPCVC
jgi:hypothetical protein